MWSTDIVLVLAGCFSVAEDFLLSSAPFPTSDFVLGRATDFAVATWAVLAVSTTVSSFSKSEIALSSLLCLAWLESIGDEGDTGSFIEFEVPVDVCG